MLVGTLAALLLAMPGVVASVAAAPGVVGPERPAEDRALPPHGWWRRCEREDGGWVEATVDQCRSGLGFCVADRGHIVLERFDRFGNSTGAGVRVTEALASASTVRLSCNRSGWMVVQWKDAGEGRHCFLHRVVDPGLRLHGDVRPTVTDGDCRTRASVAVRGEDGFVAVWPGLHVTVAGSIRGQRFDGRGRPLGGVVAIGHEARQRSRQPKIALDEAANTALAVWVNAPAGDAPAAVFARFLDAETTAPLGDAFPVNAFDAGTTGEPSIEAVGSGVFDVLWSNPLEGGRLMRRVALDPAATALPAEPPVDRVPEMALAVGAARTADATRADAERTLDPVLARTTAGVTLAAFRDHAFVGSTDDAATWSVPQRLGGGAIVAAASDERGGWLVVRESRGGEERPAMLDVFRVTPSAGEEARSELVTSFALSGSGRNWESTLWRIALARSLRGSWVLAWSASGDAGDAIRVAHSADDGRTWQARAIEEARGVGAAGFALAADVDDTFVLAWADEGLQILRSPDGGRSWSPPQTIVGKVVCATCRLHRIYRRIATAAHAGTWLIAFASPVLATNTAGHDADIFLVRSDDGARSWSAPQLASAHFATDAVRDRDPALAVDATGRVLLSWSTHEPFAGALDLDADIAAMLSTDGGRTWSEPFPLARRAARDRAADLAPALVAADDGWFVAWHSRSFERVEQWNEDRLVVAAAEATCGNGLREIGEPCDDGNSVDGDGCDGNCTLSGCGNGIVTEGEACDDGNRRDDDACLSSCELPFCGDGVVFPPREACDDGNGADTDNCARDCSLPRCPSESLVRVCGDETEGAGPCLPPGVQCTPGRCGDGVIEPGVEACDDGNEIDDDACPNDCSLAICGDGYQSIGFEQCEASLPRYEGICTDDCKLIDVCGDANADGRVTVKDAQAILLRAVGGDAPCPQRACDMDASGAVLAGDAQLALAKSVAIPVGERCSIGTGTLVFWIDTSSEIGAFQAEIHYGESGGAFFGRGGDVACEAIPKLADQPVSDFFISFNDDEDAQILHFGFIALTGVDGPTDLFRCRFELADTADEPRLTIVPIDASTPDVSPLTPFPRVGYRLEPTE